MPQPRYRLVDTQTTPYYHCISRCVRRAFLCGSDRYSGKNFDHRKQWILDRIKLLCEVFAVDVCAYAIMSNHFHLVLHIDVDRAQKWTTDEVIKRWLQLYKGPDLVHRAVARESLSAAELGSLSELIEVWRNRLCDLSWYMRCLNETIARMANAEDKCTGRFWEGRFRSQALLDEAALLSCMAYVDLNPIRAGMCSTLEDSEFTSIQERLVAYKTRKLKRQNSAWLKSMRGNKALALASTLPIEEESYFVLVDWTGRAIRTDKKGAIPASVKPVFNELGVNADNWVSSTRYFGSRFRRVAGSIARMRRMLRRTNGQWFTGQSQAQQFYR